MPYWHGNTSGQRLCPNLVPMPGAILVTVPMKKLKTLTSLLKGSTAVKELDPILLPLGTDAAPGAVKRQDQGNRPFSGAPFRLHRGAPLSRHCDERSEHKRAKRAIPCCCRRAKMEAEEQPPSIGRDGRGGRSAGRMTRAKNNAPDPPFPGSAQ